MAKQKRKECIRMCVACREMNPKKSMIRIVRSKDMKVSTDCTGKMPGKGAYLCKSEICIEKALKTGSLKRALNTDIPDYVFEGLREYVRQ